MATKFPKLLILVFSMFLILPRSLAVTTPVEDLARQDVVKFRDAGIFIGKLASFLMENFFDKNHRFPRELYRQIPVVTGLLGQSVGNVVANRRRAYASEYDYINSEVQSAQKAINRKQDQISSLRSQQASVANQVHSLQAETRHNHNVSAKAASLLEKVNGQIEQNEKLIAKYHDAVLYLDTAIRTSQKATKQSASVEQQRNLLATKRTALKRQFEDVNHLNRDLRQSRESLIRIAKSGEAGSSRRSSQSSGSRKSDDSNVPDFLKKLPFLQ